MSSTPPPVRKHLMTPGQPRRRNAEPMSLSRVQRWVMSTLVSTTVLHMAGGLVFAAMYVDSSRPDAQIGLLLIAAVFGIIAVAVALLIHQRSPLSPWLVLGVVPAVIGALVVF